MATVVCLSLLVLLAILQVVHVHVSESDADHCTLCVAMHSVVPIVVVAAAVILVRIATPAPIILEVCTITRYWHSNLFTRPPPVGS
ncbi:MAG: hypothetical protein ABSC76_20050 [Terracidiphilus sp.]